MINSLRALIAACPEPVLGESPEGALAEQRSLGPVSQQVLANVGIRSTAQLRAMGAVAAYVYIKRSGASVSLNLLWTLEGVVIGVPWRVVARKYRKRLLAELADYEIKQESGIA